MMNQLTRLRSLNCFACRNYWNLSAQSALGQKGAPASAGPPWLPDGIPALPTRLGFSSTVAAALMNLSAAHWCIRAMMTSRWTSAANS
jgi:hypothetical protein